VGVSNVADRPVADLQSGVAAMADVRIALVIRSYADLSTSIPSARRHEDRARRARLACTARVIGLASGLGMDASTGREAKGDHMIHFFLRELLACR
jgi:hypothetical protein